MKALEESPWIHRRGGKQQIRGGFMEIELHETIIAIITIRRDKVSSGTVPVFYAEDEEERERVALLVSKVTKGMIHDLENGCYVIVKH